VIGPPATLRVFIAGMSGSGKSTAAWRYYLSKYPRRILVDQTGEWAGPNGDMGYPGPDIVVWSVPELGYALRELGPRGRWTISLELDLDDLPQLVDYLIPVPHIEASPIRTVHGAVMLVDEVDLVAPPHSLRQEVRTLWRRSRHAGLSLVATTQRPEAVSREVSAQSQQVLCLSLTEPAAYDYMSSLMRTELDSLEEWTRRNPHGGLWWERQTGRRLWLTEAGEWIAPSIERPREPRPDRPAGPGAPAGPAVPGVSEEVGRPLSDDDDDAEGQGARG
jgi:hypothetical protein